MGKSNILFSMEQYARTISLIGEAAVKRLQRAHVALFGVGGVGAYAAEALARSGVGEITLVDFDTVSLSNLNRQLVALHSTLNRKKVEVMGERIRDIDPKIKVHLYPLRFGEDTADQIDLSGCDYILDAVDDLSAKLLLVERAKALSIPILCCMGAGNKLDPMAFLVADVEKTSVCPLARNFRRELRKRGIRNVKVVYSKEEPVRTGLRTPASIAFVPSAAGLLLAGEAIKDLIRADEKGQENEYAAP